MLDVKEAMKRTFSEEDLPTRGIGRLIHNGQRAFQSALEKKLKPFGITPSHWYHLNELWTQPGLTQIELSTRLGIEKASSTQVLDDLVKMGFIVRRRVPTDRRKIENSLSETGLKFSAQVIDEIVSLTSESQQGISRSDMRIFLNVLVAFTANLRGLSDQDAAAGAKTPAFRGRKPTLKP